MNAQTIATTTRPSDRATVTLTYELRAVGGAVFTVEATDADGELLGLAIAHTHAEAVTTFDRLAAR